MPFKLNPITGKLDLVNSSAVPKLIKNLSTGKFYDTGSAAIAELSDNETLFINAGDNKTIDFDISVKTLKNVTLAGTNSANGINTVIGQVKLGSSNTDVIITSLSLFGVSKAALLDTGSLNTVVYNCSFNKSSNPDTVSVIGSSGFPVKFDQCRDDLGQWTISNTNAGAFVRVYDSLVRSLVFDNNCSAFIQG